MSTLSKSDYAVLSSRLGVDYLQQRLQIQNESARHVAYIFGEEATFLHNHTLLKVLEWTLRLTKLYDRGVHNALTFKVYENSVVLPHLPLAFDGLRILHISDLHIDGMPGFGRYVASAISGVDFDMCVLTGDFRYGDMGVATIIEKEMAALLPALACDLGVYGIMGNHDYIEMVPMLEQLGLRMLVNENVALRNNGAALYLVGVDDPHFYHTHNFEKAMMGVPGDAVKITLAHSPEVFVQAANYGSTLYLAGHTHGGQICFPNGWTPYINAQCPRRYTAGAWQYLRMHGYTSRGAGASGIFVRYSCPPEITVHRLVRGS